MIFSMFWYSLELKKFDMIFPCAYDKGDRLWIEFELTFYIVTKNFTDTRKQKLWIQCFVNVHTVLIVFRVAKCHGYGGYFPEDKKVLRFGVKSMENIQFYYLEKFWEDNLATKQALDDRFFIIWSPIISYLPCDKWNHFIVNIARV